MLKQLKTQFEQDYLGSEDDRWTQNLLTGANCSESSMAYPPPINNPATPEDIVVLDPPDPPTLDHWTIKGKKLPSNDPLTSDHWTIKAKKVPSFLKHYPSPADHRPQSLPAIRVSKYNGYERSSSGLTVNAKIYRRFETEDNTNTKEGFYPEMLKWEDFKSLAGAKDAVPEETWTECEEYAAEEKVRQKEKAVEKRGFGIGGFYKLGLLWHCLGFRHV